MSGLPDNVNLVRVRGYWLDQITGVGVNKTITFTPSTTDLTDMGAFTYIETDTVTVTPDDDTGYFFADLIATDDPDLTPFAWTVTRLGLTPVTFDVPFDADIVDVGSGLMMQAAWLVDCATTTPPTPANTYYTSAQTDAAIATALSGIGGGGSAPDATASVKGILKLTGDLGGTAASPTVPGLAGKASSSHTHAETDITSLVSDLAGKQPLDSDLTAIAALTPADNDVVQRKSGAWTNRTPTQLKTDLSLAKADVGLGNVDNTSDVNKPTSTAQGAFATSRAVALALVLGS